MQNKLRQLDDKQQELIRDNLELKDLCLYLDEERANAAAMARVCSNCGATMEPVVRDDGDGSSSSTNADEPMQTIRNFERSIPVNMKMLCDYRNCSNNSRDPEDLSSGKSSLED